MFDAKVYQERRKKLRSKIDTGLAFFLGNTEAPMNYPANTYPFRQDSSFLYFFGLDHPDLAGIIDFDEDKDYIYGDDLTIDDIIWMGPQPTISERAKKAAVENTAPLAKLEEKLKEAIKKGRKIHILPPYRSLNKIRLEGYLGIPYNKMNNFVSEELIKAVVSLRSVKDQFEIEEIDKTLKNITYDMHVAYMKMAKPDIVEQEIAGYIEGIALRQGGRVAYPVILSRDGQTLHNHFHGNRLKKGDLLLNDSGAESPMRYATDITRTVPVGGKFTQKQKEIYEIVLKTEMDCIETVQAGITYKSVHLQAAKIIANGLKDLGIMKGNVDEAVEKGAYALFMPHGLGHMMGLDVHDMEDFGEKYVGYDENTTRSTQFGLGALRLGRTLQPGFILTVEPGIYFIPELIDIWKNEKKFEEYLNYSKIEEYKDFGGIRIEDDVLVTENGREILGKSIPKKVEDVENIMNS